MSYEKKEDYVYVFNDNWNRQHNKYKIITKYNKEIGENVIELGSNSGYHCYLTAEFDHVKKVVGVDLNKAAITQGDTKFRSRFPDNVSNKVSFLCENLTKISIEDESFNTIISFHTLEHIYPEDLPDVLSEKFRILKKGGNLVISLPYKEAYKCPHHVNFFDEDYLTVVLTDAGFTKEELFIDKVVDGEPNTYCLTGLFKK